MYFPSGAPCQKPGTEVKDIKLGSEMHSLIYVHNYHIYMYVGLCVCVFQYVESPEIYTTAAKNVSVRQQKPGNKN
jgi:hypothetical protein